MKVHVVVFLRKTEKFYDNAAGEYAKRLGRFCKLQITRVPPGKKVLQPEGLCVLVQPGERMISSEKLAEEIAAAGLRGVSRVTVKAATDACSHERIFAVRIGIATADGVERAATIDEERLVFGHVDAREFIAESLHGVCAFEEDGSITLAGDTCPTVLGIPYFIVSAGVYVDVHIAERHGCSVGDAHLVESFQCAGKPRIVGHHAVASER